MLATLLKKKGYFIAALNKLEHMQPQSCFPWDYSVNDSGRTVVNRQNSQQPLEAYEFLQQIGSTFIQFIPLVERSAPTVPLTVRNDTVALHLAEPPSLGQLADPSSPVTAWSVESTEYGNFLVQIFDQWVLRDVGQTFVQTFDVALGIWAGVGSSTCFFTEKCGRALAMEHNGDVYACDHYVYPKYKLGNLMNRSLASMVDSTEQRKFGDDKFDALPDYCRQCDVRFACNGECPKHRFVNTPDGQPGLNYLCGAYKRFFGHIDPYMRAMVRLVQARRPPSEIMQIVAAGS